MNQEHYHTKHLVKLLRQDLYELDTATMLDLCDGVDQLFEYAKTLEKIRAELEAKLKGR